MPILPPPAVDMGTWDVMLVTVVLNQNSESSGRPHLKLQVQGPPGLDDDDHEDKENRKNACRLVLSRMPGNIIKTISRWVTMMRNGLWLKH